MTEIGKGCGPSSASLADHDPKESAELDNGPTAHFERNAFVLFCLFCFVSVLRRPDLGETFTAPTSTVRFIGTVVEETGPGLGLGWTLGRPWAASAMTDDSMELYRCTTKIRSHRIPNEP